jgi:hypothetical protein
VFFQTCLFFEKQWRAANNTKDKGNTTGGNKEAKQEESQFCHGTTPIHNMVHNSLYL